MTREEVILEHIKRDGLGLEIGAGWSPIAPKKQGFRVHVLDHCDKKALIEKYRPHGIAVGSEFYIALSRTGELPAGTRLEFLWQVDREQSLS
jgi:hypothetical protein